MRCGLRLEYVGLLGGMTENVPIEQTDMVEVGSMNGRVVTDEEKSFIRENIGKMRTADMAKHLQRNINTVYNTINIIRREERAQAEDRRLKAEGGSQKQVQLFEKIAIDEDRVKAAFGGRAEIFDMLVKLAEAHFRTAEQELCWIVARSWKRAFRDSGK
jgi:hypothetical protein